MQSCEILYRMGEIMREISLRLFNIYLMFMSSISYYYFELKTLSKFIMKTKLLALT